MKFTYKTSEEFEPPTNLVSRFKEYFPVEFNQKNCGISRPRFQFNKDPYIQLSHGGERVDWSEFPWIASIYVLDEYTCTASLISKSIAIAAAHCFAENINYKSVKLGLYNKKSKLSYSGG